MTATSEVPTYLPTFDRLNTAIPSDLDVNAVGTTWVTSLANAVASKDTDAIVGLLHPDGWWRDLFALTWDLRTFHGAAQISTFIRDRVAVSDSETQFKIELDRGVDASLVKRYDDLHWVLVHFHFSTKVAQGRGVTFLLPPPAGSSASVPWQAFVITTHLESLKEHPEKIGLLRSFAPNHGKWEGARRKEVAFEGVEPEVVIVGAGHSGLTVAARLGALGVKTLLLDKNERVGDNWRGRYEALCLHDVIWNNHLPYLPFPPTWPVYIPAKKLASWLEHYAETMELNVWTSTLVTHARRNDATNKWEVSIRNLKTGVERVLKPAHIVFALGWGGGRGNIPRIPGQEVFTGQVLHSSQHNGAKDHIGKKVVIIGACTSAHDIAADYAENGVDVTIFQRSSTYIMSNKEGMPRLCKPIYWEGGPPTEDADRLANSLPVRFNKLFGDRSTKEIQEADREMLDKLSALGYQLNMTGGGLAWMAKTTGGGFYLDQGACQLIIDGKIKIKSGTALVSFTPTGLKFADGSELDADVVLFATGFSDPREAMRPIVGDVVTEKMPRIWGINTEGEINGCWREVGTDGLWWMYGNFGWARYFSRLLALQIKAKQEGIFGTRYSAPFEF